MQLNVMRCVQMISWVQQVTLKTEANDVRKMALNSLLVCFSIIRSDECHLCWGKSFS